MKKQWVIAAVLMIAVQLHAQDAAFPEETATDATVAQDLTNTIETNEIVEPTSESNTMIVENIGYTLTKDGIFFASPFARFKVEGIDEESGIKDIFISVDGGAYNSYKGAISFEKEGEHSINYKFVDHVGNVSYSKTYDIIVDATAPRIIDIQFNPKPYLASGYMYVGPNTEVSFKHHDDTTGTAYVEFATNETEEFTRFTTNTTLAALGISNTDLMNIRYQALDMVSNISPTKTSTVFVDATAPTVNIFADKVFEKDGIKYISSKSSISVTAFDTETAVDKILYSINDAEFQDYDNAIAIKLNKAGNYDIKVKAVDVVGNESQEIIYSVVLDTIAPTGNVTYLGDKESAEYDQSSVLGSQTTPISQNAPTTTETTVSEDQTRNIVTETASTTSNEVPAGTDAPVTE
ncbi:MAG: OmpL47-type beta-barrel domain-containing protein [Brevinema sp.]